ncbi:MAG: hypothetical protein AB8G26_12335 [Ilumatobacter sp.]
MNESRLQQIIDEFHATSAQQWLFRLVAVVATLGALLAAAVANERLWPAGLIVLPVLALASAVRPDAPTALLVVAIVVVHWLVTVDDVGTPWLPIAAIFLVAYHAIIALSASVPIGGTVPRAIIGRWWRNVALAGTTTLCMWGFVAVLDGRGAPGNGVLTALALAIVATVAALVRSRALDTRR